MRKVKGIKELPKRFKVEAIDEESYKVKTKLKDLDEIYKVDRTIERYCFGMNLKVEQTTTCLTDLEKEWILK